LRNANTIFAQNNTITGSIGLNITKPRGQADKQIGMKTPKAGNI
jgi:ClpP class serine protease